MTNKEYGDIIIMDDLCNLTGRFIDGKSFLLAELLGSASSLRGMTDEYGIIPCPKCDTAQSEYLSIVHDAAAHIAIPTSVKNTDLPSAAIETW